MLSAIYNYLQCKFFPKAVIGRKRRIEECNESPPKKLIRVDSDNIIRQDSSIGTANVMQSKEEYQFDEDDGCCIVAEIPNKKWGSFSMMARKSIRKNQFNHPPPEVEVDGAGSSEFQNTQLDNSEKDVEVVGYVSNNNIVKSSAKDKNKTVSDNLYKPLLTVATSNSNNIHKSRVSSFQSNVRKRMNFLRESYRLTEKYQYSQLLQSLTNRTNNLFPSHAATTQRALCGRTRKPSIPLIDLTKEKSSVAVNRSREDVPWTSCRFTYDDNGIEHIAAAGKEEIPRINSFQEYLKTNPVTEEDVVEQILSSHTKVSNDMRKQAALEAAKLEVLNDSNRKAYSLALEERLRTYMRITAPAVPEVELEIEDRYVLPKLTADQEAQINKALSPSPPGQVLVEKFGLQIKRRDMQTLKGLNWLNDEVINFYMNLIMERAKSSKLPDVYAFNTFFYPKLISSGHASLKRWTKKVDIFSYDMVLVPIHLGMHWCMSLIDFRNREVRYYDSMGSSNNTCLQALLTYLEDESLDKKKTPYATGDWKKRNVEDIPQQMNGSDCGVFSCMFAEHLSRDTPILFSQDNMPYFRRKMVLEILEGKLLT